MNQISTIEYMKKTNSNGYIKILTDDGWQFEHLYVMTVFLGRNLNVNEVVHHEDMNKLNNSIDNLILFPCIKDHSTFHRKIRQHGYTNPRRLEIRKLRENMINEHIKNKGVNI